jgi:imidazolonepropionase-like amidohydrolase
MRWNPVAPILVLVALSAASAQSKPVIAIRAGTLIDGQGGAPIKNAVVIVTGDRITGVGANLAVPAGARVIDWSQLTVLPGFIDAHTHLASPEITRAGWDDAYARWTPADWALVGVAHARQTLEAGFTTVREVGSQWFADVSLRNAINQGYVPGPRMQVAGHALSISGGHCDNSSGFAANAFGREPNFTEGIANTPDQLRAAVRYQVKYGADVIKICATGGVVSFGDSAGAQQYDADELKAAVDAAHLAERRIAAHAHGTAGIKAAVLAGVNSIEHGSILDEETARLMAAKGTYLVSTLTAGLRVAKMADEGTLPPALADKGRLIGQKMPQSFRLALKAGVKIALGVDNVFDSRSTDTHEFTLLVQNGMTPMQAIEAGTRVGAELLGWEKDVGTVVAGRYADLVAVRGDPLKDISEVERPAAVMKGGMIVKEARP